MLSTLRIENSPFSEQQLRLLQSSVGGLNPAQSQWLSGYLAGRLADSRYTESTTQSVPDPADTLAIIYATETGNSKSIAIELAASAEQQGFNTELHSMGNFRPAALRKLKNAAFIISTHGEGDPPDEALELFEYLENERAPRLTELNYRILALGDRSYQLFCEAGRKLDDRLRALGAQAFGQRVECDVDFAASANIYKDEIIRFAHEKLTCQKSTIENSFTANDPSTTSHLSLVQADSRWSRTLPFSAEVGQIQKITGPGSARDVYHLELSLENSGLQYQPGDALGVWAPNDPDLVAQILETLHIDSTDSVRVNGNDLNISEALIHHLEITRLSTDTVLGIAKAGRQSGLEVFFSGLEPDQQSVFMKQRQLADLVDEYPPVISPQALVDLLRPLSPRSYSIASSQNTVDDEIHLTVATLTSNAIGKPRKGVASGFLGRRLSAGGQVRVFLESNDRFHLPENREAPIIMIAAGTGIAPYRAFMQELESRGASPDSWLIFGNPHLRTDFLYQRHLFGVYRWHYW